MNLILIRFSQKQKSRPPIFDLDDFALSQNLGKTRKTCPHGLTRLIFQKTFRNYGVGFGTVNALRGIYANKK